MRHFFSIFFVSAFLCACVDGSVKVGETLPAWEEGELDVHFINTARGECTFQIFPDGTTFLVDASGSLLKFGVDPVEPLESKPSDDISAGKVIVDYINHFSPAVSKGHLNYFLLTHRHGDHYGHLSDELPVHEGGFILSSLPEIGSSLVMDKILDRDYPDFGFPIRYRQESSDMCVNYRKFLEWTKAENGSEVEKWDVGSRSQVVPVNEPDCGVVVRNYAGNGWFWTGEGEESYTVMPTKEEFEKEFKTGNTRILPDENCLSCAYILTYGDFDLFMGGDLQHDDGEAYPYKDVETLVAKVAHKVEVMKANHHATTDSHNSHLMSVLRPDVWVVNTWRDILPKPEVVDRVVEANPDCDIFCTNIAEKNLTVLGEERMSHIDSSYGHVVIRVARGGKSFMVYTLEDSDEEYTVKSIHGPYLCTKG